MKFQFAQLFVLGTFAVLLLPITGCGGGSSEPTGPSYQQQFLDAQKITNAEARARRMFQLALNQYKGKDDAGGKETLKAAARACAEVKEPLPRSALYAEFANIQAQIGNKLEAGQALKTAQESAVKIESIESRILTLSDIATVQGKQLGFKNDASDTLDTAETLLAELDDPQGRAFAQVAIVKACAAADLKKQANRVLVTGLTEAKAQADPGIQASVLTELSGAQAAIGDKAGAVETLETALKSTDGIERKYKQVYSLVDIAKAFVKAGDKAQATKVLAQAETLADQVPEPDLMGQAKDLVRSTQEKVR